MKKIMLILMGGVLCCFMVSGFAANTNLKVGVVQENVLLKNSPRFIKTESQLQKLLKSDRNQALAARNKFQTNLSKLQKNGPKMSASARSALQSQIKTDQDNLISLSQKLSKAAQARQVNEMNALLSSLKAAIRTVAKKDGLNIVLTDQSAVYFDQKLDITKQVAKIFG